LPAVPRRGRAMKTSVGKKIGKTRNGAFECRGGGWKKNSFKRGEGSQMGKKYEGLVIRSLNVFR